MLETTARLLLTSHHMTTTQKPAQQKIFTPYQVFIIAILTIIQFSVILDFMVLFPTWCISHKKTGIFIPLNSD
jgi:hypothetical protein